MVPIVVLGVGWRHPVRPAADRLAAPAGGVGVAVQCAGVLAGKAAALIAACHEADVVDAVDLAVEEVAAGDAADILGMAAAGDLGGVVAVADDAVVVPGDAACAQASAPAAKAR